MSKTQRSDNNTKEHLNINLIELTWLAYPNNAMHCICYLRWCEGKEKVSDKNCGHDQTYSVTCLCLVSVCSIGKFTHTSHRQVRVGVGMAGASHKSG